MNWDNKLAGRLPCRFPDGKRHRAAPSVIYKPEGGSHRGAVRGGGLAAADKQSRAAIVQPPANFPSVVRGRVQPLAGLDPARVTGRDSQHRGQLMGAWGLCASGPEPQLTPTDEQSAAIERVALRYP